MAIFNRKYIAIYESNNIDEKIVDKFIKIYGNIKTILINNGGYSLFTLYNIPHDMNKLHIYKLSNSDYIRSTYIIGRCKFNDEFSKKDTKKIIFEARDIINSNAKDEYKVSIHCTLDSNELIASIDIKNGKKYIKED